MKLTLLLIMAISLSAGTITCQKLYGIKDGQITSITSLYTKVTYDDTSAELWLPKGSLKFERVPHLPEVHSYKGILHPTTMMWSTSEFTILQLNPTTALAGCSEN